MTMQPRGPLMIEHRLIMRMISLIGKEVVSIEKNSVVNQSFIRSVVDFIRTYADRTHHGKEEDILFRDLAKKQLSGVDAGIMAELIHEHVFGRLTTDEIVTLADAYQKGDTSALPRIATTLRKFADFYPRHIEKEDAVFFPLAMTYLSESEQKSMLDEFREFDANLIHDKYKILVEALEK
jgi:hemerythrin-like domain-containing protein